MELFMSSGLLAATCLFLIVIWLSNKYNYWKNRGVETPPFKFGWGHVQQSILQKRTFGEIITELYNEQKPKGAKYFGVYIFHVPIFVVVDIDLVKSVMQNDFQHFVDRGVYSNERTDPLSAHLFSLEGKKWKLLRSKLTPAFTTGKMKMMFETLVNCTKGLGKVMDDGLGSPVNVKQIFNRFTMDVIGSCAFGIDTNSLENPDSEFLEKAQPLFRKAFAENLKGLFTFIMPEVMGWFGTKVVPDDVTNFFMGVVNNTVSYRENNNVFRKDFMHLLIQLKNRGKLVDDENLVTENITQEDNTITIEEIAAQAFIFFEAGFETSSSAMSFCLFELGQNEEIQSKVRDEIKRVLAKYDGQVTYESIGEMEYLERCVSETLRKYPTLPVLNRVCTKEYTVPGSDLVIEKGTKTLIPAYALHYDPEFYPNPEKFDPDRFTEENKKARPAFCYLPFGEGPRICIGMRFGLMQTKVGLATILRDYEIKTNDKSFPLDFDPQSFTLSAKRGIWIDYKKI